MKSRIFEWVVNSLLAVGLIVSGVFTIGLVSFFVWWVLSALC